ncbi:glycosyltransferase [Rhodoferax sp.]|uniref:glycosyltransferase n=1 Tax=Rhodoferax sp. TaxID=50421 RepID=UPI00374CA89E
MKPICSVAVFAHNEAAHIAANLRSIAAAAEGVALDVVVLANGCSDRSASIVRELAWASGRLRVVEVAVADKANAWNVYVHDIAAEQADGAAVMHVFIDADVRVEQGSLQALAQAFAAAPTANAVGAMPTSGRDQQAWVQRMLAVGTLAGGMYALRAEFVARLRQRQVRLPQGLVGEDWLVSLLAHSDLDIVTGNMAAASHVVFAAQAGFAFRSLSPWRPKDYRSYARRLWRYALRGVQFEMLFRWLARQPPETLPPHMEQFYLLALPPSRLKWTGWDSLLRFFAVLKVRKVRAKMFR